MYYQNLVMEHLFPYQVLWNNRKFIIRYQKPYNSAEKDTSEFHSPKHKVRAKAAF